MNKIQKIILLSSFFFLLSLLSASFSSAFASEKFSATYDVTYDFEEEEITLVSQNIKLTNLTRNYYATEYTLSIGSTKVSDVEAKDGSGKINPQVNYKENSTEIFLKFNDKVIGQNRSLNFQLKYRLEEAASKNGFIWELNVPKLANIEDIETYNLSLRVPKAYGDLHYISPKPKNEQENDKKEYRFDKEQLAKSGVVAAFGPHQVFDFELKYHLKNDSLLTSLADITLPPDTETQQVYFTNINPLPEMFFTDEDGNYLARYKLERDTKLDITVMGSVKIIANDSHFQTKKWESTKLSGYLKPDKYWESNDPLILEKAKELKTPQAIYEYVVNTLNYGYERVKDPNLERMGALTALRNPDQAICMEFTDLFIALARAAGIPARELDGFAYTENKKLRPTTIGGKENSDVLHAWPQYYDFEKSRWISVDPTWGSTTGGLDYFNKLDTNHFVFAIRGISSQQPYPAGSYKIDPNSQGDVKVTFSQSNPTDKPKITLELSQDNLPAGFSTNIEVQVKNTSSKALQNAKLIINTQELEILSQKTLEVGTVLPYETKRFNLKLRTKDVFLSKTDPLSLELVGTDGRDEVKESVVKPIKIEPFLTYGFVPWVALFALATLVFAGFLIILGKLKKKTTF
jgi:transglutaminase-like putative cysteine protease